MEYNVLTLIRIKILFLDVIKNSSSDFFAVLSLNRRQNMGDILCRNKFFLWISLIRNRNVKLMYFILPTRNLSKFLKRTENPCLSIAHPDLLLPLEGFSLCSFLNKALMDSVHVSRLHANTWSSYTKNIIFAQILVINRSTTRPTPMGHPLGANIYISLTCVIYMSK